MKPSLSIALTALVALAQAASAAAPVDAKKVDFVKDVQPIFKEACVKCHGTDPDKPKKKASAGLWLDDKAAALKGGKSGAAIIPGDSKNSLLFKLLSGPVTVAREDETEDKEIDPMPKVKHGQKWKPLTGEQISTIQQWIDQGADWQAAK